MLNSVFAFVRVLVCLLALGALSVAVAQSVNVEFDESVDFTKYKTFVIRDGVMNAKSPALNNSLTKKRIQTEIENALIAKGLSLTTDQADLEVFFQFGTARVLEQKTFAARNGTRVINTPQSEGTLAVDLQDVSTHALVWHSTASEGEPNPVKLADKLDELVKKSIAKYPSKKKNK